MRNILVDKSFFLLSGKKSANLISSLKELNQGGYNACFDYSVLEKYPFLKIILKNEGIKYKTINKNGNLPSLNIKSRTIEDAVKQIIPVRSAVIKRVTKETSISIKLDLDGKGESKISTGIGFFDHMLEQIARHANIQMDIKCYGDLDVDEHHTIEDTGLALGEAINKALGSKKGIQRYGFFIPMDESVSLCTIDLSGRSYLNFECAFERNYIGAFPLEMTEEFFRALAAGMKANIFIRAKGKNDHHKVESIFKAFAKSLNEACRFDERNNNRLPSTKGVL